MVERQFSKLVTRVRFPSSAPDKCASKNVKRSCCPGARPDMKPLEKNIDTVAPETDEFLDIVNENDEVIRSEPRSKVYKERNAYFRVVNAFIRNDQGQLWIPTRSATKELFPNALDFSMGGHVQSGESYDDAFMRETEEELGFRPDKIAYRLLGKLSPLRHGVAAFMQVYEISSNDDPHYNLNDYTGGSWLSPQDVLNKISQGVPAKEPDLRIALETLYKKS